MRQILEILFLHVFGDNYIFVGIIGFSILLIVFTPLLLQTYETFFPKNPPENK